jgi:hypothetical protein
MSEDHPAKRQKTLAYLRYNTTQSGLEFVRQATLLFKYVEATNTPLPAPFKSRLIAWMLAVDSYVNAKTDVPRYTESYLSSSLPLIEDCDMDLSMYPLDILDRIT